LEAPAEFALPRDPLSAGDPFVASAGWKGGNSNGKTCNPVAKCSRYLAGRWSPLSSPSGRPRDVLGA